VNIKTLLNWGEPRKPSDVPKEPEKKKDEKPSMPKGNRVWDRRLKRFVRS
jgi:hypothetical protein